MESITQIIVESYIYSIDGTVTKIYRYGEVGAMLDPMKLLRELTACGINEIVGVDDSGNVMDRIPRHRITFIENSEGVSVLNTEEGDSEEWVRSMALIDLVKAAHQTPVSSNECISLKTFLGETSAEWAAYLNLSRESVRTARSSLYSSQTDVLLFKSIEDSVHSGTAPDFTEWVAAKDAIRAQFPYSD